MVLGSSDANRVQLLAGDMVMEQEEDLNLFYITEHHLVNMTHPQKGVFPIPIMSAPDLQMGLPLKIR